MNEAAAVDLFHSIEDYVARAVRPFQQKIAEIESKHALELADLRARISAQPDAAATTETITRAVAEAIANQPKPEPGKDAVVDYERIGAMIRELFATLPKAKDGNPGKDAIVDYERIGAMLERMVAAIPKAEPGKDAAPVDYERLEQTIRASVDRAIAAFPKPKDGDPGKDAEVDYDRIGNVIAVAVDKAVGAIPKARDGEPGMDASPVDYALVGEMIRTAAVKAAMELPRGVEATDVEAIVARAVAARFEALPDVPALVARTVVDELARIPRVKGDPGRDFDPELLEAAVVRAVAALPKAKDGEPGRDADENAIIERVLAQIPRPKDGEPGKDADLEMAVRLVLAQIPKPKDGEPGKDADESAIVRRVLELIPKPRDGDPGKDADENAIVFRVLEKIRVPKDGEPGRDADEETIVERVIARIPKPKDGEPGKDGDSIHPDTVRMLIQSALAESLPAAIAALPKPADGKSVDPAEVVKMVDEAIEKQLVALLPYIKGEPGAPGFSPDDLELELRNKRTLVVRLKRDGMPVVERTVRLPIPIFRGLYQRGQRNEEGDVRVYAGSSFCAVRDTDAPIGGTPPSPDWLMISQRGRDA